MIYYYNFFKGVSPSMTEVCSAISNNSGGVESGNEIVNKFTSSVVTAMSSAEDSSDSECDRINSKGDRQVAVSDPVDIANYNTPSKDSKQENEEENREVSEKFFIKINFIFILTFLIIYLLY